MKLTYKELENEQKLLKEMQEIIKKKEEEKKISPTETTYAEAPVSNKPICGICKYVEVPISGPPGYVDPSDVFPHS